MMRSHAWTATAAGIFAATFAAAAAAQTPVQPQPRDPNMPAQQNTVPEKMEGRAGDTTGSTGTLSDRLEKTDGVIRPTDPGTGRTLVPPDTGTTPVIPPAGSPGSARPNADPK